MSAGVKTVHCEILILGGGVAGLAAGMALGERAIVIDRAERPGGLVKTEHFGGHWFDQVIHVLYFPDSETAQRIIPLFDGELKPLRPQVWVETLAGTARYPFQMHLGDIKTEAVVRCLRDLAATAFCTRPVQSLNFEDHLLRIFGREMCEIFLFPYNRKLWKRPLNTLASAGSTWTIARPDFERVLLGALKPDSEFEPYNAHGYYPHSRDGSILGMELLSNKLACGLADLRLEHKVEEIDLERRIVRTRHRDKAVWFRYEYCFSTLPLPVTIGLCAQTPAVLRRKCGLLKSNRVLSVALAIRGDRPQGSGHWRYYADEALSFTRLVYMHEFDSRMAPCDGWGLLAEITEPSEWPVRDTQTLLPRVKEELRRIGVLPAGCEVAHEHLTVIDPAYIVFDSNRETVVREAIDFLRCNRVEPLGRYGRWEYSSMGQVMRDGFALAKTAGSAG